MKRLQAGRQKLEGKALILLFVILIAGLWISWAHALGGVARMKKVVMVIPENAYRDEELNLSKKILEESQAKVKVASTTLNQVKGMLGASITPDMLLQDIDALKFDAVVFIGGIGTEQYWNNPPAQQLAINAYNNNRIVAAICIAPVILANAGILNGKRATVSPSEASLLIAKGAKYTGRPVERDGNIITASGPTATVDFANRIVEALNR